MDRGAWRATVRGVIQSWTHLKRLRTDPLYLWVIRGISYWGTYSEPQVGRARAHRVSNFSIRSLNFILSTVGDFGEF